MNNKLYYYQPNTIYTRLNDLFEEGTKKDLEDFAPENFIKPNLIGKVIEQNMNSISKEITMKNKLNDEILKKRYVNKDLIKSWIGAIQTSR
jgi:hypothetical protein